MQIKKVKKDSIKVFAPASVANVGCGFDVLGFAINGPGDIIEASFSDEPGVRIISIEGDNGKLPLNAKDNTAGLAVLSLLDSLDRNSKIGIDLRITKKMPMGSGLGSSAASSAGAVFACNQLIGEPFDRMGLLPYAIMGEMAASGSTHADNVAASLLGGFILVRRNDPPDIIPLKFPDSLFCTIIHPHIEIKTKDTRMILRKDVTLAKAVRQWGNVGAMVAGLYTGDFNLIGRAMEDEIIEPIRSVLIPGYDKMKETAIYSGALGFSISGAGPSVFALAKSQKTAEEVGEKTQDVLTEMNLDSDVYVSQINKIGCYEM
ncbi:MAG: homoserine kinase [Balneolaceae bacterium]